MEIQLGDIFLADLNPVKGNEQGGLRPVLIFQKTELNNIFNTIFIIPITSNLEAKSYMLTYFINKKEGGLKKDSIALIFQARTISKLRLIKKVGNIPKEKLRKVKFELNKLF